MINLGRRLSTLEAARQRRQVPDPGLSGLLTWAQRHEPSDSWWEALAQCVDTSPYVEQLTAQHPSLLALLQEAIEGKEHHR